MNSPVFVTEMVSGRATPLASAATCRIDIAGKPVIDCARGGIVISLPGQTRGWDDPQLRDHQS